jgi:adenosine kinase
MRGSQWLLPANSTAYIGAVGSDDAGATLKKAAATDGLKTIYYKSPTVPTGRCAVLITGIQRSLCTDLLAANEYKIAHLQTPEVWASVEAAKFFYVGGYFLTVSPDSALEVAKHAAETKKVFSMNLSAPFIPQFFKEQVDSLSEYWDILFGT